MIRLRLTRIVSQLTQYDLARRSRVSQTRLSMLERGIVSPSPEERAAIARVFCADPDALFQEVFPERLCKRDVEAGTAV